MLRNQQNLSLEAFRTFSQKFGTLHVHLESASHYGGFEDVNSVSNIRDENGKYIGLYGKHVENFHSDLSWAVLPSKMTLLKSSIRPEGCGDTVFVNSVAAFAALPAALKESLIQLKAHFSYLKQRMDNTEGLTEEEVNAARNMMVIHPVITAHMVTGEPNIFANPSHTVSLVGVPSSESNQILEALYEHTASPEFTYRHIWQDGDLVIWDNQATHHRATGCPDEKPRMLVRTTIVGNKRPVSYLESVQQSAS